MSLTGILLDVSGSMRDNIGIGTDEEGGPWVQSIFKVIDDLIKHDVSSEHRVFAIGVGAKRPNDEIFDVLGTLQQLDKPATEPHINQILDILERNGARNIRKWTSDIKVIQDVLSDNEAVFIMKKLQSSELFRRKFINEFLPSGCQDYVPTVSFWDLFKLNKENFFVKLVTTSVEDVAASSVSCFIQATKEEIEDVVKKATCFLGPSSQRYLKYVGLIGTCSIFSVQEASRIIRGCVNEKELSTERKQELLENVEPFIYGRTPLYESLEKATKLFEADASENKLLFMLSDGYPTDGSYKDSDKIKHVTSKLTEAGVTIVSCFITRSTDIHSKHLFDKMQSGWKPGAQFLFSLSSKVPTQHLPRAILVKRGWTIDVANNETKLFIQVNHPDNLR